MFSFVFTHKTENLQRKVLTRVKSNKRKILVTTPKAKNKPKYEYYKRKAKKRKRKQT